MRAKILVPTLVLAFGFLVASEKAQAQKSEAPESGTHSSQQDALLSDQEIDLLRKDLRSRKKQVIAANMNLTSTEAEKFWPVYDEYTAETIKLNDKKYAFIKKYAQDYGHMTDQRAEEYVRGMVGLDQSAAELRLKFWPRFRQVVSARNTALFFQMDRRISFMIDLQLSSQIPLIEP
jgi:hypothetical protein